MGIRSGAPARPASEARDADPTHGSSDFQAFLQSEIGGLRAHGRLKDLGKPFAGKETVCGSGKPFSAFLINAGFASFSKGV